MTENRNEMEKDAASGQERGGKGKAIRRRSLAVAQQGRLPRQFSATNNIPNYITSLKVLLHATLEESQVHRRDGFGQQVSLKDE